jgi:hypothetical protein
MITASTTARTQTTTVMLLPELIEQMVTQRQAFQVMKFRTTLTDCVPNF